MATDNLDPQKALCWSKWASEALWIAQARTDLNPPELVRLCRSSPCVCLSVSPVNLRIAVAHSLCAAVMQNAVIAAYTTLRYNFDMSNFSTDLATMFAFVFAVRLLCYAALVYRRNKVLSGK